MNIVEAFVYGIPRVASYDGVFMTVGTGKPGVVNISDLTVHRPFVVLVHPAQIRFMEANIDHRQAEFIEYFFEELRKMQIIGDSMNPNELKVDLLKRLPLKKGPARKPVNRMTFAQMRGCFHGIQDPGLQLEKNRSKEGPDHHGDRRGRRSGG